MTTERFFRALADRTRLDCLLLLLGEREMCVCELVHALALSQPKVSRHLAQLRDAGIVADERRGQWVYYRLHPVLPDWSRKVLETVREDQALEDYRKRLAAMPDRPFAACD
ncbi:metalloregulator ArsR/SmtB family transcription factor [Wenzhouxiangella sp. EGI_FJ10305]|uniref:metalloregulator ArsR/SmtB family transcription factor n=1 Tax=Wenzhouxiangella sp. EGI_FJ10305 TaxID=3243768 RepID=UPI0035DA9389